MEPSIEKRLIGCIPKKPQVKNVEKEKIERRPCVWRKGVRRLIFGVLLGLVYRVMAWGGMCGCEGTTELNAVRESSAQYNGSRGRARMKYTVTSTRLERVREMHRTNEYTERCLEWDCAVETLG